MLDCVNARELMDEGLTVGETVIDENYWMTSKFPDAYDVFWDCNDAF